MFPYLLRTGSGFIYTFSAVWLVGLLLSAWIVYRRNRNFGRWDGLLAAVVCALLLGRFQFVWQNGEWFAENPAERWNFAQGGFGYAGAVAGALVGLVIWCWITRNKIRPQLVGLIPALPLLYFAGWLACWFDGCGYGAKTFIGWYTAPLPDNFGLITVRYQTQLAGMLLAILVGLMLYLWFRQAPNRFNSPATFWVAFACLVAIRAGLYLYQGDSPPLIGSLRSDLAFASAILVVSLFCLVGEIIYTKGQSGA